MRMAANYSSRGHFGKRNGRNLLLRNEIPLLLMQLDLLRRSERNPRVQIAHVRSGGTAHC